MFNARLTVRHASGETERRMLQSSTEYRDVLGETFGVELTEADLALALDTVARKGEKGAPHPFFA